MKIPKIKGVIDRRILINYQVEPQVLAKYLPEPFKPKLVNGKGIAGICLIRLKGIRPVGLPSQLGISSENGAHRVAVEWLDEKGGLQEGVFIPRRDTSSALNALAGGRVFPGVHHLAKFSVEEKGREYKVGFISDDGESLSICARESEGLPTDSVFENLSCVSDFFERGSLGYSPDGKGFEGLELRTKNWEVSPLEVDRVESSFFDNREVFPEGSVKFDNALLMKEIEHEWVSANRM